ncbi:MAG: radical SAM protein [Bacillota bacterium]
MRQFIKIEFECMCNLDCNYCHAYMNKHRANIKKIIHEMEQIFSKYDPTATFFRVEGTGEITLYPEIVDYLSDKAEREGYIIEVLSNGILAEEFIKETPSLIWIISLDGHTAQMNRHRNLSQPKVNKILDTIIEYNTEIQCVYSDQSMEDVNEFIEYLSSRNYSGFLHISPRKYHDKPLEHSLDYNKLIRTDFVAGDEYFKRWEYIINNNKRDFECDFFKRGYVYRIMRGDEETKSIKCDCASFEFEYDDEEKTSYNLCDCSTCICQFEYDVGRKLDLPGKLTKQPAKRCV